MGMFQRVEKCAGCRTKLPEEARFCPSCARPAQDVYRSCPKDGCDGIASPWDEFCPRCGSTLPKVDSEVLFDILWSPPPGELARRFRVDTEDQAVEGSITVRFGHEALLLGDGALLKALGPGAHSIETTFRDLQVGAEGARRFEVVYADTSERTLEYSFAGFPSNDGVPCLAELRLVVEVREPERMLANFFKNAENLTNEGLRLRVRSEVRNAVEEAVARWPADELAGERRRKDELAGIVADHLKGTMEGLGFSLVRVETLDAKAVALDEVRTQRVQRAVQRYEHGEEVARIAQDADFHEQKAQAWGQLRETVQQAEMDEVADKAQLRDFLRRLNKATSEKDLVADSELDELTAAMAYKKEDREKARAFLVLRIEEEQSFELERLAAKRRLADLETEIAAARNEVSAARERAVGAVEIDDLKVEAAARAQKRRQMFDLDVRERETQMETGATAALAKVKADALKLKGDVYQQMKLAKAQAAALKLQAAGEAGLQADQLAALFAEEQPELAKSLEAAFAGRGAEERAQLERRHAQELREIMEAAQGRDSATMASLIEKLAGALGGATHERATAGDREAEATRATVGMMRGEQRPERKRCRVCHCEWMSDTNKCPNCGETVS